MLSPDRVVFLLDVDNTLLDNDRFGADLGARIEQAFGAEQRDRYWAIFSALRDELSYADYLGALQKFRTGLDDRPELLQLSSFLLEYPFASRLYPRALDALAHLGKLGLPVILSDGDIVFQPRKVQRSGIWNAVQGRVLIDVHKESALEAMQRAYPARHYVMIDDKAPLLSAMKRVMADTLTTVFVRQGHYAAEFTARSLAAADFTAQASAATRDEQPDLAIELIGDVLDRGLDDFLDAARERAAAANQELT
jgi:FMN phosphatase YigB (HAD superfamily)